MAREYLVKRGRFDGVILLMEIDGKGGYYAVIEHPDGSRVEEKVGNPDVAQHLFGEVRGEGNEAHFHKEETKVIPMPTPVLVQTTVAADQTNTVSADADMTDKPKKGRKAK